LLRNCFAGPEAAYWQKISPYGRKFLLGGAKYLSGQACGVANISILLVSALGVSASLKSLAASAAPHRRAFTNKSLAWIHKPDIPDGATISDQVDLKQR
jgi:hypothetical protein